MRIRCVTLNVKGLGSDWFESRFDALIGELRPLKPDLVCFQETTIRSSRGILYDQARSVGEAVGLPISAFAPYGNPVEVMSRDQGGVGLISRWPIGDIRNRRLCPGHDRIQDVRVAMIVTLLTPDGPLKLATTHLSWKVEETEIRLTQMGMILQDFLPGPNDTDTKCILLGDFNATEDEPVVRLVSEHFLDAYRTKHPDETGYTWDNRNPMTQNFVQPDRRVDYIFCSKRTTIHSCQVVLNHPTSTFPSDHFGVMADLEW